MLTSLSTGFHVCIVPENATYIFQNSGGFDTEWAESGNRKKVERCADSTTGSTAMPALTLPHPRLQHIILRQQMAAEDSFVDVAR